MEQKELNFNTEAGFKFKITNIRKNAYPTNFPEESDYFQFKIGDLLTKGRNYTTIFEVVAISRISIDQAKVDEWNKHLRRYHSSSTNDKKASDLIEDYKKNGNFGVCKLTIKPVLRSDKKIGRPRGICFLEIDNIDSVNYRGYRKADINQILNYRNNQIAKYNRIINKATARKTSEESLRQALSDLISQKVVVMEENKQEIAKAA